MKLALALQRALSSALSYGFAQHPAHCHLSGRLCMCSLVECLLPLTDRYTTVKAKTGCGRDIPSHTHSPHLDFVGKAQVLPPQFSVCELWDSSGDGHLGQNVELCT